MEIPLDPREIIFGVHADGVVRCLRHMDRDRMLQESELLELFSLFQP